MVLIAIPTKSGPEYLERQAVCEQTWLNNCPCDYKFFRDADFGLDDTDPLVRQKRMKVMCSYALEHGYDYIFRVDADAYVWVNRLLGCGFEQHDYMGWCLEYTGWKSRNRTAFGGAGFFLSRKAMRMVVDAEHFPHDGIFWGDIFTGQLLFDHGIRCHQDSRFVDSGIWSDQSISIHPVDIDTQKRLHENQLSDLQERIKD